MATSTSASGADRVEAEINRVPDPLPLTIGGMIAAVGPQAINFGISIGGGEAYLLPNVAARGALGWHWLMVISVIVETALVYECIKYSCCTGRSFFAGTNELAPRGFWPWFWAVAAILTWAWPAWMGGAVIAAQRFTGISTPQGWTLFGQALPPQYIWAVLALLLVLVVFYFSNRTYAFLEWFFKVIMVVNIVLVLAITVIAAKPDDYLIILKAYAGILFFYPEWTKSVTPLDIVALYNQPGGSLMWVSFWVVAAGWGMGRYSGQVTGMLRPPEKITAEELRWNTSDPQEMAKMKQWVRLGGMSLIIWWAIIGGLIMTYLYSVAGYAYLHGEFLKTGKVPTGVEVPLQMAIVAQGVTRRSRRRAYANRNYGDALRRSVPLLRHLHRSHDHRRDRGDYEARGENSLPGLVLYRCHGRSSCGLLSGSSATTVFHVADGRRGGGDLSFDRFAADHDDQQSAVAGGVPCKRAEHVHPMVQLRDGHPVCGLLGLSFVG